MVNGKPTRFEFVHARGDLRRWQRHAVEAVAARPGREVRLVAADVPAGPAGVDLLFAFERLFVGRHEATAADRVETIELAGFAGPADVVVDLTGTLSPPPGTTLLRVGCLGRPALEGALAAVLDERVPVLEIARIGGDGAVLARWPVAIEDRRNTLRAASQVLGRLAHMVRALVDAHDRPEPRLFVADPVPGADLGALVCGDLFVRSLSARVRRRLERRLRAPADWRVVWRRRADTDDPLALVGDPTPFRLLRDDGARFYADPFLWDAGDRTLMFLEEFPYATGRGILSVAEIDADGRVSTPRPILDEAVHLSYPQVFAHAGAMWMVPETSGRRTVELWRAEAFPDGWRRHAVLLADVDLADATLVERDGAWWMFGTSREPWCSSWDALHVFTAPTLEGPWRPIDAAPVKVDVATARPAGRMIETADGLLRPVQDSSRDYGGGLALTRVDRLGATGFSETVVARFATPAPLRGLHTWNRAPCAGGLVETLDVFAAAADFGDDRRLDLTPLPRT